MEVATVTQLGTTQPDDFVPQQLESGVSKLDGICPELLEHLRPVASFYPEDKLELIVVLRTFVTNTKPRAGRSTTDLLVDMVGKESGLAGHRASRVAGVVREMDTLEEMTVEIRSLFSEPALAAAVSDEATTFGVSDATLNRALAWAWAVCGEVTEVSTNRSQLTQLLPRTALFSDAFQDILTSSPVTARRAGAAASTGGRSAASREAAAEAITAAAAPPRAYATPANVANLLEGYEMVNAGGDDDGADGGGDQAGPNGGQTGGDEDRRQTHPTGGADLGAVAPRAPQSPGRNAVTTTFEHVSRKCQTGTQISATCRPYQRPWGGNIYLSTTSHHCRSPHRATRSTCLKDREAACHSHWEQRHWRHVCSDTTTDEEGSLAH